MPENVRESAESGPASYASAEAGAGSDPAQTETPSDAPAEGQPAESSAAAPRQPAMLDLHSTPLNRATTEQNTPQSTQDVAASAVTDQAQGGMQAEVPTVAQTVAQSAVQATQTAVQATSVAAQAAGSAIAPAVSATVQATKQASQQVSAAVAQQAQKITVAPRKAIYLGKRFLVVYGTLVGAAGLLAVLAKRYKYFPADVGITRLLQKPDNRVYEGLMNAVSELGWRWISVGTRTSLTTLMWAAGFRMESAFTMATWSGDLLTIGIKTRVLRPRPTKDLVRVTSDLGEASFPSGHVVHYVTFYGFLFYLVFIHLKRRWFRTALLTLLAGIILLVGPSRIYMGQHWPSDVGGAYLVGTLWLGVIIVAYLETKSNYTLHTAPPFFLRRPQQLG